MNYARVSLPTIFLTGVAIFSASSEAVQAHTATIRVENGQTVVQHSYPNYRIVVPARERETRCCRPAVDAYPLPVVYGHGWAFYERRGFYRWNIFHHSGVRRTLVLVP
ncbi:MAG: hypothetical protein GTO03_03405 [Planctomycetales bacterium]|nr:hypothetical protein [Planctomycetales bacterium]